MRERKKIKKGKRENRWEIKKDIKREWEKERETDIQRNRDK